MRLPRVRFTVRRMMVLVAVAGVLLAAGRLTWRGKALVEKADKAARSVTVLEKSRDRWIRQLQAHEGKAGRERLVIHAKNSISSTNKLIEVNADRRRRYLRAAYCFWESVPSDLP